MMVEREAKDRVVGVTNINLGPLDWLARPRLEGFFQQLAKEFDPSDLDGARRM